MRQDHWVPARSLGQIALSCPRADDHRLLGLPMHSLVVPGLPQSLEVVRGIGERSLNANGLGSKVRELFMPRARTWHLAAAAIAKYYTDGEPLSGRIAHSLEGVAKEVDVRETESTSTTPPSATPSPRLAERQAAQVCMAAAEISTGGRQEPNSSASVAPTCASTPPAAEGLDAIV